jgi:hypothetical protein
VSVDSGGCLRFRVYGPAEGPAASLRIETAGDLAQLNRILPKLVPGVACRTSLCGI